MHSKEIRQKFIDFFKERSHTFVPSSPVVPTDDPTLLFTNAGMNQFKDVFLGTGTREYKRAVNTQKCIRVSGKHNDLEEVGHDTYHHTLFEMLGTWSFGDYYKKDAIKWAWELYTGVFKLPKEKIYATVFESDNEAEQRLKKETDIDHSHVRRFGKKDNFWEMGETGPCGPCSEIHIDLGPDHCDKKHIQGHKCDVNGGCARYIELWNLVFIQYNRGSNSELVELPAKHIDTGAGFERLVAVLQNKKGNYDTDLFQDIISETAKISGINYGTSDKTDIAHRVIADHIRALTFAIADGASPSNEGRGYVMRRILRRATNYGRNLNLHEPFLFKLVPAVIQILGDVFPDVKKNETYVTNIIKAEETSFNRTLDKGLTLFEEICAGLKTKQIPGTEVFKLYDTFGFPPDLTNLLAQEKGLSIDMQGFEAEMNKQKDRARAAGISSAAKGVGGEVHQEGKSTEEKHDMEKNHTATHLLHAALQKVLGTHATQAGSLVEPTRLRFDFKHFQGMTPAELKTVEELVNAEIKKNTPVEFINTTFDKAKAMGAMALFGEKYGNEVRVVKIGDFSMELCGGHHLKSISEIGEFKITSEGAIAAGTRRIEAVTGKYVDLFYKTKADKLIDDHKKLVTALTARNEELNKLASSPIEHHVKDISSTKATAETIDVLNKNIEELNQKLKEADKEIVRLKQVQTLAAVDIMINKKTTLNKVSVLVETVENYDSDMLKTAASSLTEKLKSGIVFLASKNNDKLTFYSKVSDDLVQKGFNAGILVKEAAKITGGGGGGQANAAQAGGKDISKLNDALEKVKELISSHRS